MLILHKLPIRRATKQHCLQLSYIMLLIDNSGSPYRILPVCLENETAVKVIIVHDQHIHGHKEGCSCLSDATTTKVCITRKCTDIVGRARVSGSRNASTRAMNINVHVRILVQIQYKIFCVCTHMTTVTVALLSIFHMYSV